MITPRLTCSVTLIDTTGILRKDPGNLDELKDSFEENVKRGLPPLIHPIVVDSAMRLISGSRRLAAHKALGYTEIDYAFYEVLDDGERTRLDVAANYQKRFTWQEHALAVAKYHHFYSTNAALKGTDWGIRDTARVMNMTRNPVNRCTLIAEYLHANDKEIWDAETVQDAFRVLVKREEEANARLLVAQTLPKTLGQQGSGVGNAFQPTAGGVGAKRILEVADEDFFDLGDRQGGFTPAIGAPITTDERPGAAATVAEATTIPLSSMLLKSAGPGDLSLLERLGEACCDHIVTDPPYGVEDHIKNINQGEHFADAADVASEHVAPETARMMAQFYPLAVRALRPKGYIIMWCDSVFWWQHCMELEKCGLSVQRWPLIWLKTSQCVNFCANINTTKNFEFAVIAHKPGGTLITPQKSSVWTGGSDIETKLIGHPFAKPFGLWEWCYRMIAQRGAEVLDPFVGKGSSVLPAIDLGLRPRGIECSQIHYDGLIFNVQQKYLSLNKGCKFS